MAKKDADTTAKSPSAGKSIGKKIVTILVTILVIALVGVTAFLVYRNNQASKATHAEFEAAQKDFATAETAYKEASQKLVNAEKDCEKSYQEYKLCPALTTALDEGEKEYAAVKETVDALSSESVDEMEKASETLKSSIETVQDLENKASDAVTTYEEDLLKAVQDEHDTLATEARTNLKEAKALLSASKDKTSDEELWDAYSRILDVHEKELSKQDSVKGDEPDTYISSSDILEVENAAIVSAMNHLKAIYENAPAEGASADASDKASPSESPSESQSPKDKKSDK